MARAYLTGYQYYENEGNSPEDLNWGEYQYLTLAEIINNYMLVYVGNDKIVNNVDRNIVRFHAKRGVQELNYDCLKNIKVVELSICDNLTAIMPPDYINWVRISLFKDGKLIELSENSQTNFATSYLQDNDCKVLFDGNGDVLKGTSLLDQSRLDGEDLNNGAIRYAIDDYYIYEYPIGGRFGLDPSRQSGAPTFSIDRVGGVINFSSDMAGEVIVLEYVSDGMEGGDDTAVSVNKFFEDFIYRYITWCILNSKEGVQEYKIKRAQKNMANSRRNAKIRISNLHPSKIITRMREINNWIK